MRAHTTHTPLPRPRAHTHHTHTHPCPGPMVQAPGPPQGEELPITSRGHGASDFPASIPFSGPLTSLYLLACAHLQASGSFHMWLGLGWSVGTQHPLAWFNSSCARRRFCFGHSGPAGTLGWQQICFHLLSLRQRGSGCEEGLTSGPSRTHVPSPRGQTPALTPSLAPEV